MVEFDAWADYYDLIHQGLPGEAEFYVGQAKRIGKPTLEIGCGTGRIAIPIALSGVDVVGLDNSRGMLEQCQRKYHQVSADTSARLFLVQADMRAFAFAQQFELIIMPYRTFMHCQSPDDQRACLRAIREHLVPGGLLILNVWAARPTAIAPHTGLAAGHVRLAGQHRLPDDEGNLLHFFSSRYDEYLQELRETHFMVITDTEGVTQYTQTLTMNRTWLTRREMEHLVRAEGYEAQALFGDFDCRPFTASSSEMIWVLRNNG